MSAQNLTLLTDLYELTMMQGYFESQTVSQRYQVLYNSLSVAGGSHHGGPVIILQGACKHLGSAG